MLTFKELYNYAKENKLENYQVRVRVIDSTGQLHIKDINPEYFVVKHADKKVVLR